jgi:hypothetical protein
VERGPFIVMTGIPASGKTSLALRLSPMLEMPIVDKDDILDGLITSAGAVGPSDRVGLSRKADTIMRKRVELQERAILASHWQRPEVSVTSGTPTEWLTDLPRIIEVHCSCDPRTAVTRFVERTRHPAHGDAVVDPSELLAQFRSLAALGPLGIGRLVEVDTEGTPNVVQILRSITEG